MSRKPPPYFVIFDGVTGLTGPVSFGCCAVGTDSFTVWTPLFLVGAVALSAAALRVVVLPVFRFVTVPSGLVRSFCPVSLPPISGDRSVMVFSVSLLPCGMERISSISFVTRFCWRGVRPPSAPAGLRMIS
jgi:hypothetical protein